MWFGRKIEFWITLSTNILICKYPNRVHFFVFINKTQTKREKKTGKSTFILHSSKQNSRKANHVYPLYRTFWPLNWKGHASLAPSPTFYLFRQPEDLLLSLTFCQSVLLSKGVHFLFLGAHYWVTNDSIHHTVHTNNCAFAAFIQWNKFRSLFWEKKPFLVSKWLASCQKSKQQ